MMRNLNFPHIEIDLFLETNMAGSLMTGNTFKLNSGLIDTETELGNTLMGKESTSVKCESLPEVFESNSCNNILVS